MLSPLQIGPVEWLAFDIETAGGRPEDAEAWCRAHWSPAASWKPETIGTRWLEAVAKKRERLALLDASEVKVISLRTPGELGVFHSLQGGPAGGIDGAFVQGAGSERELCLAFRAFLATRAGPETLLVGHNITAFDLPRLRLAFLRNGLQLPALLSDPAQPVYDVMREFTRRFSADLDHGLMIGLAEVQQRLGLPQHKNLVSGAEVPRLIEAGQTEIVLRYALLDVATESEIFSRMTGRSVALQ